MNRRRTARFDALARLFRYPGDDYATDALALANRLVVEKSKAADEMHKFAQNTARTSLYELEELYTRTFDLNPSCSPEIGWHLFGEEYVRGLFMVHMRNEMRQRGLEEGSELPDHLVHVLAVLGDMADEPAREMARACLCPAIGKMLSSLEGGDQSSPEDGHGAEMKTTLPHGVRQPAETSASTEKEGDDLSSPCPDPPFFLPLVTALAELTLEEFDLPPSSLEAQEDKQTSTAEGIDPLHSTPCGGCGAADIVPLDRGDPSRAK